TRPGTPGRDIRDIQIGRYRTLGSMSREEASRAAGLPEGALIAEPLFDEMQRAARYKDLPRDLKMQFDRLAKHEAYRRHAGEVEARNVQFRFDKMRPGEEYNVHPMATQDYPTSEQLFRFNADTQDEIRKIEKRINARNTRARRA